MLFNQAIVVSLKMPFLSPSLLWIMLTSIGSFLAISLIAPISSLRLAFKLAKTEIAIGTKGL